MPVQAYAARARGGKLQPFQYEPQPLRPSDIEVAITHCGICHSDIHLIDNDWKVSAYPLVPGHEIVGTVSSIGSEVSHLKLGDRVGIGWQCGACFQCEWCVKGDENLCAAQEATCLGHFGGFADRVRCDSRFAFQIPAALQSENAAPLLCGGITVYSPLRHFEVTPTMRVGVIGIGGLGHLALQFAAKWGCEVTAFTTSATKAQEARAFGAAHVIDTSDPKSLSKHQQAFDFILNTAHADLNWNDYLSTLRPNGTLCFVGVPPSPLLIPAFPLITGRRSICGSPIGSRSTIAEMLEFCARHSIRAKTEVVPMGELNAAVDRVRTNKARYRMVLRAA